jgi:hypothetical protein
MRKFILIAAMVLVSASAQAGGTRSLTLASNDEPAAAPQPTAVEAPKPAETPQYFARPTAVTTPTTQPKTDQTKPVAENDTQALKVEKPKRKRESTEARVIRELHRHGIYW